MKPGSDPLSPDTAEERNAREPGARAPERAAEASAHSGAQSSTAEPAADPAPAPQEWERALEDPDALSALYSPHYLRQCSGPSDRLDRIAELKRRIDARAYNIDCDRIAEELLIRGDLAESS